MGALLAQAAAVMLAFLTGGGVVKLLSLRNENKTTDLSILMAVVEGVGKDNATVRAQAADLRARVDKLEERERHMLTRAAIHEAWDQIAFAALVRDNPAHPPPPPLTPHHTERDPSDYQ